MNYVYIYNSSKKIEKMQVISIFNLSISDYKYIIYKSLKNNDYFIAKYKGDSIEDLDTNLDDLELKLANKILLDIVGEEDAKSK